ncbi:MAG: type II toxin-antitoxin system RelE/ParE family toxin [bacterium]
MAKRPIRFHPLAEDEADDARLWYFARNPHISQLFFEALDVAVDSIAEAPQRWPRVYGKYRRYVLRTFPFSVVYVERTGHIEVIAVAHHRRRPGYWKKR